MPLYSNRLGHEEWETELLRIGASGRRILVLEAPSALPAIMRGVTGASVVITRYETLDAKLIARVAPDTVLAPLFGRGFDVSDVARRLSRIGYRGQVRGVSHPLPEPAMIIAEIRANWPRLDFDLITLPDDGFPPPEHQRRR